MNYKVALKRKQRTIKQMVKQLQKKTELVQKLNNTVKELEYAIEQNSLKYREKLDYWANASICEIRKNRELFIENIELREQLKNKNNSNTISYAKKEKETIATGVSLQ